MPSIQSVAVCQRHYNMPQGWGQERTLALKAICGIIKHVGALEATKQLVELCGTEQGQAALDVGCGVGIDITERTIDTRNERARREYVGCT